MRKLLLGSVLLTLGLSFANAQGITSLTNSEKKVMELKKIIVLNPDQENALRLAYDRNQSSSDSVLLNVADPATAAALNFQAAKQLNKSVMTTLSDSQRVTYIRVISICYKSPDNGGQIVGRKKQYVSVCLQKAVWIQYGFEL